MFWAKALLALKHSNKHQDRVLASKGEVTFCKIVVFMDGRQGGRV
jgi:hypothetical protein